MQKQIIEPLVTVIVVTYNSSKYILETLESIQNQTYSNIEIVITDDFSTDLTVSIVKNWIEANKKKLNIVKLVEASENTGTPENSNRGLKHATGQWIKTTSGDDTLEINCIEKFVNFIKNNCCDIVFSKVNLLKDGIKIKHDTNYNFFSLNPKDQFRKILSNSSYIFTPGVFLKRDLIEKMGGFDIRFKIIEDLPLWIKLGENNYKFFLLDEYLVNYRVNENSISQSNSSRIINQDFYKEYKKIFRDLIENELKYEKMFLTLLNYKKYFLIMDFIIFTGNKNSKTNRFLKLFLTKINVFNLKKLIKKFIHGK